MMWSMIWFPAFFIIQHMAHNKRIFTFDDRLHVDLRHIETVKSDEQLGGIQRAREVLLTWTK